MERRSSLLYMLQYRYTFDVCRLGKHIQWLHQLQTVGRMKMAKYIQITCQGCRITGNVHNPVHGMLHKRVEHGLLASRAWWIEHQSVNVVLQCW